MRPLSAARVIDAMIRCANNVSPWEFCKKFPETKFAFCRMWIRAAFTKTQAPLQGLFILAAASADQEFAFMDPSAEGLCVEF